MNRLELDLLFNLDFRLKVNLETFGNCFLQLEKQVQLISVNGSKDLRYGGSADELCQSKLVHQSYGSKVFQGCR
jgi:hypothetical protein